MTVVKALFAGLLIISIVSQANGAACNLSSIVVSQERTGEVVEGQAEYEVTVSNECRCAQSQVLVRCFGLSSVELVDPNAIRPIDDENCLLKNGGSLVQRSPLHFRYAWKTPQSFPLVSSKIECSRRRAVRNHVSIYITDGS
ncbi:hypothetical protein HPP92_019677 [Vanilla planifolia]|uniref:Uncharacterized protein n=1 Tax=Vanilla planifolia TaxID=51239 RepID=A0A835QAS1_VANPL|nr:hypothetical protein HPP92_019677 [Vanilla planifolia]